MAIPVSFIPVDEDQEFAHYGFGLTKDVSPYGVCIISRSSSIPDVNTRISIVVTSEENRFANSDVSVKIRGRVKWVDKDLRQFGLQMNGNMR